MNIVDQQTFRDAMSCMGAAVNIITTDGPAGRAGFTASAVCSGDRHAAHITGVPESWGVRLAGIQ
ncbi:oxidoreductase, flavin:NADH component [Escherichia coli]|uniref:Oxidoreductase, flavin:NADH component n=1 Tax=Escherichia coli TaxID=562 RepID=A0A2X1JG64_ECOLX|nr:oxidoreductase, flavin:NADH component [Escherichia coli]